MLINDKYKTRRFVVLPAILTVLVIGALGAGKPIRERIEWSDIWVVNANRDDLPRVLLVGDSITRQYFGTVEKVLEGKVNLARCTTSKFLGAPDYLPELEILLKNYRFDVIHINNGLHGFGYTEARYEAAFPSLLGNLKKYAPDATLIWATTTPVREKGNLSRFNEQRTARVRERNRIALRFMKANHIPVDDLYGVVAQHPEFYKTGGTHFNPKGVAALGAQVASVISNYLPRGTGSSR